ncbi:hypothetical protein I3843_09G174700 [Carya illinoinensis]|uniref:Uncharacterized protein n=1 Tax=Carya illinoinensis TaxID=32201 RepID=A0A922E7T8_CARIL|nr:hypothetical protein I3760_09G178000 [Carya illinoinensis]KAG6697052.1 hypothetical protein I3842_09G180600 [Carya illinoinensis]KAG7964506.1 hypothetical protein I3843_09G174700 [Carya illinoinensis]
MKISTKPISSPGRTEKFPPPLMRFLRTNVGSKSRGRSRSSPMFVRKKNAAIETQEPSSPKVTCMGQVRVRRSSKQAASAGPGRASGVRTPRKRRCKWLRNALFCHHLARKIKPKSCRPAWRKWVSFFKAGFRRKTESREYSSKVEQKIGNKSEPSEQEDEEEEEDEKEVAKVFVPSSSSPPKNALLLTRCRSAPYRSSSLAWRFWGSPLRTEETEQSVEQENTEEQTETEKPPAERESISDEESGIGPEMEGKLEFFKEFEGAIREGFIKSVCVEELKAGEAADCVRPLILTRCKSEPARTAEKLYSEMNFWENRRLGFADSSSPHVL